MSGVDDTVPNPGGFEPTLCFTGPTTSFENGFPFGEFAEHVGDFVGFSDASPDPSDAHEASELMVSAACSAAAVKWLNVDDLDSVLSPEAVSARFPNPISRAIESQGEFLSPDGEDWWKPLSRSALVLALVRASSQLSDHQPISSVIEKFWLPVEPGDIRTTARVSQALCLFLEVRGVRLEVEEMMRQVFSGRPPTFTSHSSGEEISFPELQPFFSVWEDDLSFYSRFSTPTGQQVLNQVGLYWPRARVSDLFTTLPVLTTVSRSLELWHSVRDRVERYYSPETSGVDYTAAGSAFQLCAFSEDDDGVSVESPLPFSSVQAFDAVVLGVSPVYRGRPNSYFAYKVDGDSNQLRYPLLRCHQV